MPDPKNSALLGETEISDPAQLPPHPAVSVYMAAYNHERFIAQAIDGIATQRTAFSLELIIGEDCSHDSTLAIALQYQKRFPALIRIIKADRNVGVHQNFKRCFRASRGKYIAFCEADDYWHCPTKLQMQFDLMEHNAQMAVCHTDYDRQTRWGISTNRHATANSPFLAIGSAYTLLLQEWTVMTATAMYRRSILAEFQSTSFCNTRWPFGDYNKLLFASLHGTVGYIPVSTAVHRKVRGSAGNKSAAADLYIHLANEECRETFLRVAPLQQHVELLVRSISKKAIYKASFYAGDKATFLESYWWLCERQMAPSRLHHLFRLCCMNFRIPLVLWRAAKYFIDLHVSAVPR